MHDDEVGVDDALVRRLLAAQLPQLADLPLVRIEAWGTDHAIFRLGDDLSVRLPKIGWAKRQGEKEQRWLPVLAPHLPIAVPVPMALGEPEPEGGFPFAWYVSPWLDGVNPTLGDGTDLRALAREVASFVLALQGIDARGAPPPGRGKRGGPLADAGASTRAVVELL